jgi:hypothetical protein
MPNMNITMTFQDVLDPGYTVAVANETFAMLNAADVNKKIYSYDAAKIYVKAPSEH